jgi:hypothetical protein
MPQALAVLGTWSNFYVVIGSSAAGLTGLMFVVITLAAGLEPARRSPTGISIFSTPTVLHLSVALIVSAILSAPWHSLIHVAAVLSGAGVVGLASVLRVMYRSRRLTEYHLDLEDWAWYAALPFLAYATIIAGAIMLPIAPKPVLFPIAGGVLLLILIGIHNAWDIVTFLVVGGRRESSTSGASQAQQ